jgi:hypothetical protein
MEAMRLYSRRSVLGAFGAGLLFDRLVTPLRAAGEDENPATPAKRGRRFLEGLFDPALDLLPEFRGAKVYWLFHDNYLASKVLAGSNPKLAAKITAATRRLGVDQSGKIEILFGEAKTPLPFRQYELIDVKRVGDKIIMTEIVKDVVLRGWEEYADLLFLAAIAEADRAKARRHFDTGMKLWDGTGFNDRVATKHHQYATYKLALSLIAAQNLEAEPPQRQAIAEQLLALQADDGGWITDYDARRKPLGRANVETTCLAILGLEAAAVRGGKP